MFIIGYIAHADNLPFQAVLLAALALEAKNRQPALAGEAEYYLGDPAFRGGKTLPPLITLATLSAALEAWLFEQSGARYGRREAVRGNFAVTRRGVSYAGHCFKVYRAFGIEPVGLLSAREIAIYVCYTVSQFNATLR